MMSGQKISKKIVFFTFIILSISIWYGCDTKSFSLKTVKSKFKVTELSLPVVTPKISGDLYQDNIQPLFNRRCVVCHSCYNSPCQVKLSSFEGTDRGGSKIKVYDGTRLKAIKPTRLFVDAHSTKQWRKKGFYSVINSATQNPSFMEQLVSLKLKYKDNKYHEYYPEAEDLTCSKDQKELTDYILHNPHQGMPFGFPELSKKESQLLGFWFTQGAPGPSKDRLNKLVSPSVVQGERILKKWEKFLNKQDIKTKIMSRYIYEHLFLAHIQFKNIPGDNYYLVRSRTPSPFPIDEIAMTRPYDNPGVKKFYYRFRKVISTIVHKTHIVYHFSDKKMLRYKQLFLDSKWRGHLTYPSFSPKIASNPFQAFQVIPAKVRYQFLLDDVDFFVRTFIRGPVCKGQIALNSIRDHFSVAFMDPDKDLFVNNYTFEKESIPLLATPASGKSNFLKSFYYRYHFLEQKYVKKRMQLYDQVYKQGFGLDLLWKDKKKSLLTIYRHLDSATILSGQWGGVPKTMWVIDYPLLERIYYTLVAGFNVFGNISHQLFVRTYMDDMRIEGENNFLAFIPQKYRFHLYEQWHKKEERLSQLYFYFERNLTKIIGRDLWSKGPSKIAYRSNQFVKEFLQQFFSYIKWGPYQDSDPINNNSYQRTYFTTYSFPECSSEACVDSSFSMIANRYGAFVQAFPEERLDLMFVRVRDGNKGLVYTIVKNKSRLNVDTLLNEDGTRNPNRDTFNIFKGFIGSYPNLYFDISIDQVDDFLTDLVNLKEDGASFFHFVDLYGVRRLDSKFWEINDWMNDKFKELDPENAGIFDLNRYANIRPSSN